MFSPDQWLASTGVSFYNGVATQSLRFDRAGPKSLTRTPSSASNRKTWTWSGWIKPSIVGQSAPFFTATTNSAVSFNGNTFRIYNYNGSSNDYILETNAFYRDSSAWYHIAVAIDTTQGTASNRIKIYINGEQITSFSTETYPSLNFDGFVNSASAHKIGSFSHTTSFSYDGYMAEVNFVDGLALDPTYFGETKNGVWIAKKYTGSYGTNGFRLQFNQTGTGTASSSTIGADTSGNNNHWTSSGIVASDCNMPDSPENNFPTMNSNNKDSASVLSEGNLKLSNSTAGTVGARNTMATPTSGKYYVEFAPTISGGNWPRAGIARTSVSGNALDGETWFDMQSGASNNRGSGGATTGAFSTGDVGAIAFDADAGKIYLAKNNTWQNSGDPVNGTGYMFDGLTDGPFLFSSHQYHTANVMIWNFGQDSSFAGTETAQGNTDANGIGDFYYAPPSGFLALCTSNLPEPTISPNAGDGEQADDYFNTILYTGNGSARSITGVGFQPDWVWFKNRISAYSHELYDSNRGTQLYLLTNGSNAEISNAQGLTAFNSDGYSVGTDPALNENAKAIVAWNWKANGGTTSSNTDGSITSTVQASTESGFSIVTYTGTGSLSTVGHSLGVKPSMMIIKNRDDSDSGSAHWLVYHEAIGATHRLKLDSTEASGATSVHFNNTEPTSSVFTVNTSNAGNGSGDNLIAYCFADIEGYSKFGSYTGNGSNDGTFVYLGFRPAWIMVKRTNTTGEWGMHDSVRDTYNVVRRVLLAESSSAEIGGLTLYDFISNGFKLRDTNANRNASGSTYIYMAFAENPFKYANAR